MKADRQVGAINREIAITTTAAVLSISNPHSTAATTDNTATITVSMQQCVHPTM